MFLSSILPSLRRSGSKEYQQLQPPVAEFQAPFDSLQQPGRLFWFCPEQDNTKEEKPKMIFADKLIDLRKKNGWSQEELAEKLNVSSMLRLRPFRSPDAKAIISWMGEPEEFYKWSAGIMGDYPVSEKKLLETVSAREDNTGFFPLTAFDESGPVGFFTVRTPGEDNRKVRFGFVIVDPEKRGHGYGSRMLRLGLKFMFEIYGANEVSLGVFDHNLPAYHCYKSVGFRETGVRETYKICGKDWTAVEMVINN